MPRRPRITLAGVSLHLIQRGNNRQACFFAGEDYKACLHWLKKHAREHECAVYTSLATASKTREAAYRELSRYQLDPGLIDEIRTATNGNYALGSQQFQAQISALSDRRVTKGKSGRPRKNQEPKSLDLFDNN